jgi:hypothetical protein
MPAGRIHCDGFVATEQMEVGPDDFPFLHDFWGYDPESLAGRHVWTDLDRDDRELFPIRPRNVCR